MIDELAYKLLCCQLGLTNEKKEGAHKQASELIARLKTIKNPINKTSSSDENHQ